MSRVLVIEDDLQTAQEIMGELQRHGFEAEHAGTGDLGLQKAMSGQFDILTVDRMLPDTDGLNVVSNLRERGLGLPVLMVSALSDIDERIRGLRAGGDDYLTKPFAPEEMVARIEVLLRRTLSSGLTNKLRVADVELDIIRRTASREGNDLDLLPTEYKLLEYLMRNSGQVVTRTMIFEAVWSYHFDPGTNIIDVHVGRLRKKIDPTGVAPLIKTIRGSGFMFCESR
ncbi:MAG: response regulator transcription factor [Pseudomonadales bacterium]|nr:response regulator transcription factor [Pseudomonadales bacterium]